MQASGFPTNNWHGGSQKQVVINLNTSKSIGKAIEEVIGVKRDVAMLTGMAVNKLCAKGEEYAKSIVPVDTGDLQKSITHRTEITEDGYAHGVIEAGTDHAMFVEFGTGIRGRGSNYPLGDIQWVYDVNERNWQGQEAQPFMAYTGQYLENHASEILGELK